MGSLDREIRSCLVSYLVGEITLDSFQDWFVAATWDVHEDGGPIAEELTYMIQHALAEYTSGHRTDEELKRLLRPLTNPLWVDESTAPRTGSTSMIVKFPITLQSAGSDKLFSVAFV